MTIIRSQADIAEATTADLVETYNQLTGKAITKFSSRAAGEVQVSNALLAATDRDAHSGVPKGATPKPITQAEADAKSGDAPPKDQTTMAKKTPTAAPAAKKTPAPAKKTPAAAKKTPASPAAAKKAATPQAKPAKARSPTYTTVRLTEPSSPRRPHASSKRSQVLEALRARKKATIEQLSDDVGYDARSFVHKLLRQEWCEVVAS